MRHVHPWPKPEDFRPTLCKKLRQRFAVQPGDLASRADVGLESLMRWERAAETNASRRITGAWRMQVCHALRQLAVEQCLEWARVYSEEIAADPKREAYTYAAAVQRRYKRTGNKPKGMVAKKVAAKVASHG